MNDKLQTAFDAFSKASLELAEQNAIAPHSEAIDALAKHVAVLRGRLDRLIQRHLGEAISSKRAEPLNAGEIEFPRGWALPTGASHANGKEAENP